MIHHLQTRRMTSVAKPQRKQNEPTLPGRIQIDKIKKRYLHTLSIPEYTTLEGKVSSKKYRNILNSKFAIPVQIPNPSIFNVGQNHRSNLDDNSDAYKYPSLSLVSLSYQASASSLSTLHFLKFLENSFEVLKLLENIVEVLKILENKLESMKILENNLESLKL
ncbi:hypothetical protein Tco_0943059 [Tanacetum coccineum]